MLQKMVLAWTRSKSAKMDCKTVDPHVIHWICTYKAHGLKEFQEKVFQGFTSLLGPILYLWQPSAGRLGRASCVWLTWLPVKLQVFGSPPKSITSKYITLGDQVVMIQMGALRSLKHGPTFTCRQAFHVGLNLAHIEHNFTMFLGLSVLARSHFNF